MSDIVERLRSPLTPMRLDREAADEITHLRAEVERLNKSRNKWGQKYNKLLEKHKVTLSQLKTAVWSDSEECKFLTAEVERLRAALRSAYEVYAGSDGFIPETAAEGYQQQIIKQMVSIISAALEDTHE